MWVCVWLGVGDGGGECVQGNKEKGGEEGKRRQGRRLLVVVSLGSSVTDLGSGF
jgi:hypothetical protein